MRTLLRLLGASVLLGMGSGVLLAQVSWYQFGDRYPSTPRPYDDVTNYFTLEGPGNDNPGNYHDREGDSLRITDSLKAFIARQFKYVLFDQDSFCDRDTVGGEVVQMMPPIYHQEACDLMNRNPDLIVFPYFCFTLIRPQHPWYDSADQHEDWFLHERNSPTVRLQSDAPNFYMMDVSNSGWRNFYVKYVRDTVLAPQHRYRGAHLDNMTSYPFVSDTSTPFPKVWF